MKMMAFLGGELSNSAKFFSLFANVSYDNMSSLQFSFGQSENNKWRKRLAVVRGVEDLKNKLS